eukprot:CAMPEP_0194146162 /NCGR_PEP_ID=MMETSP0152-20130528/20061_1 /TAXON_ID=1049557 /ORGANISM="Thalassiothrix antarctica, Strain L6-D1" /LENGTH=80 /DNA_ID=CAMNT_0038846615 /DNA_START=39 /DNA_END=284 /DNA_ORIENTATION=-
MVTVPRIITNKTRMTGMASRFKNIALFESAPSVSSKMKLIPPVANTITNAKMTGIGLEIAPVYPAKELRKPFFMDIKRVR